MNIVYFDIETKRSAHDVGGWHKAREMGVSVGVTYNTLEHRYIIYEEKNIDQMLEQLQRADLVVGFNILKFDYEVLHGYTIFDLSQLPTLDLLVSIHEKINHRLSLDSITSATFGAEKTADGLQAIKWYQQGEMLKIAEYCCFDVKLTRMVHMFGMENKQVFYMNKFSQLQTVQVDW